MDQLESAAKLLTTKPAVLSMLVLIGAVSALTINVYNSCTDWSGKDRSIERNIAIGTLIASLLAAIGFVLSMIEFK